MKYELLISPVDKEGNRRKAGDIIAVMPSGHLWSETELKNYLVIPYECADERIDSVRELLTANGDSGEKRKHAVPCATLKSCCDYDDKKVETLYQPFITGERYSDTRNSCDYVDAVEYVLTGNVVYDKTTDRVITISAKDAESEGI